MTDSSRNARAEVQQRIDASAEGRRLAESASRTSNWKRWGPYLSERQWGTVREDYSGTGECWTYFPHDHARSRAYRWGEDGLLGMCDSQCRLCFGLALWNGRDPILKERMFGLTGPEGNHGEDAKECWYYLDATPTSSYLRGTYKYPQAEFPYRRLVETNAARGRNEAEFELADTGVFDENRYFDVIVEYAKDGANDILIRITVANRGPDAAHLTLLPTLWFRNTWSWGGLEEGCPTKPSLVACDDGIAATHATLGEFIWCPGPDQHGQSPSLVFTENETNHARLYGGTGSRYTKDAFHDFVIAGNASAVNPEQVGTKAAALYHLDVPAGGEVVVRLRLSERSGVRQRIGAEFDAIIAKRRAEADEFYALVLPATASADECAVSRQAYAGLLWSKQFYHYVVADWYAGDPAQPPPPSGCHAGRNDEWRHLYARDVISMPDAWEYPWFAAWDLAFHTLPLSRIDSEFAKQQLILLLREWYMHPNGQIPAYEFAFSDVNPPVHAWACWRVYKLSAPRGARDRLFLERTFQKLLLNFTWWVNRKDPDGNNVFAGGFLGLDNIGAFDRSKPLPHGGQLAQADGTAWMAFYCATMLGIALELASEDAAYEDIASKFFEHFVAIIDAINGQGGIGLWDEGDGFYYDQLLADGKVTPLKVRSLVGLVPLIAVENIEFERLERLPSFKKRLDWFMAHRPKLAHHVKVGHTPEGHEYLHVAIVDRTRLQRLLHYALDEREFLSPFGLRALSKIYGERPFEFWLEGECHSVRYTPGESDTGLFGGNSNWRGPVWFPLNYLLIEALERYHHFYGDDLQVEFPTGSGHLATLGEVALGLHARLAGLFLRDDTSARPVHGGEPRYRDDPHWRELVLFYEYFHGETGRGLGASHQTGWTALVARCIDSLAASRPGSSGA